MSTSPTVRKKRNFKALQLDVAQPPPSPTAVDPLTLVKPAATRTAPGAPPGARKKPPKMDLSKSKSLPPDPSKDNARRSPNSVTVVQGPTDAPPSASANRTTYHSKLSEQIATLDINGHTKLDLRDEDLKPIGELGQGNGGTVTKVIHEPTKTIMARKVSYLQDLCGCGMLTW